MGHPVIAFLIGLSLLSASTPDLVVTETALPECVLELDDGKWSNACLRELPVRPIRSCVDKHAREVAAGGKTFQLEINHPKIERVGEAYIQYVVFSDQEAVYDFLEPVGPSHVWAFFGHGDDWILETRTRVVVNGVDMAAANNFDEVSLYRIIDGRPVFLARRGSKYSLMTRQGSIAEYDRVFYHMCCNYSVLNPGCTDDKLAFFAIRGDKAFYVVVNPPKPAAKHQARD